MSNKRNARPLLVLFLVCFFGILVGLRFAMHWVDEGKSERVQAAIKANVPSLPETAQSD